MHQTIRDGWLMDNLRVYTPDEFGGGSALGELEETRLWRSLGIGEQTTARLSGTTIVEDPAEVRDQIIDAVNAVLKFGHLWPDWTPHEYQGFTAMHDQSEYHLVLKDLISSHVKCFAFLSREERVELPLEFLAKGKAKLRNRGPLPLPEYE
jgi:hypothetical protein